jgi:hypothetical protein
MLTPPRPGHSARPQEQPDRIPRAPDGRDQSVGPNASAYGEPAAVTGT